MGKRRDNCDHDRWEILPGNNIRCQHCGETIEEQDLFDQGGAIEVIVAPYKIPEPQPLTHHIKGLT